MRMTWYFASQTPCAPDISLSNGLVLLLMIFSSFLDNPIALAQVFIISGRNMLAEVTKVAYGFLIASLMRILNSGCLVVTAQFLTNLMSFSVRAAKTGNVMISETLFPRSLTVQPRVLAAMLLFLHPRHT